MSHNWVYPHQGIQGTAGAEKDATGVGIDEAGVEKAMTGVEKGVTGDRRSRVRLERWLHE